MTKAFEKNVDKTLRTYGIREHIVRNGVVIFAVKPSQLRLTPAYQREPSDMRTDRMKENFDWDLFGIPVVVPSEKRLFEVADGGNRMLAFCKKFTDDREILVQVALSTPGWKLFAELNAERVKVSNDQIFYAKYIGAEPSAVFVVNELKRIGVGVAWKRPQVKAPGFTKHPAAFGKMLQMLDENRFRQALQMLQICYSSPDGQYVEAEALKKHFVLGFAKFLTKSGVSANDVVMRLQKGGISSAGIVQRARKSLGACGLAKRFGNLADEIAWKLFFVYRDNEIIVKTRKKAA